MREKVREVVGRLRYVGLTLGIVWKAARAWTVWWLLLLVVQGVLPAAIVFLTKWLVDSMAAAIGAGVSWEAALPVLVPAALMASLMLLQRVLGAINEWVSAGQAERVGDHIKELIHARAAVADYAFFESSDYHDQLEQVNSQASGRTLQLLQSVGGILQSMVTFISIAAILLRYSVWLPVVLLVATLPAFFVVVRHNRRYHAWWKASTAQRRLVQYYDHMLTLDIFAAEVRINDLGDIFQRWYQALRRQLFTERMGLMRQQALARLGAGLIALLVTAGAMAWVALRALRGAATIGDLALFYQAFNQGQSLIGQLLQGSGQLYTHTLFLEHLFLFLDLENRIEDPPEPVAFPSPLTEGVRIEDVTFTYPGSERPALEGFDLHIPAGRMVAIVGENGAGKSTLTKLLCRFYDPEAGRITVDGIDLRDFAQAELRRRLSVMFQLPIKYQMTAAENIRLGDMHGERSLEDVIEAGRQGGAHEFISRFPRQYDTLLGRWFSGGTELSGGEWQRVALSRAFLRRAPIVILDEPTSFMDSWAENEWIGRFKRMVEGQTVLVITHRFTTAMRADIIHVVEEGRIVESGSHAELIRLGGRYATSWTAQMQQAEDQLESGDNGAGALASPHAADA